MSVELNADSFFDKMKNRFSDIKKTVVGNNGKKLTAVLSAAILANSLSVGQAHAATHEQSLDLDQGVQHAQFIDNDVQEIRGFLDEFNTSYTTSQQNDVMLSGYYISEKTGQEYSSLKDLVDLSNAGYANYLNRSGVSLKELSDVEYASKVADKAITEGYTIDDIPQYIISGVDSIYPNYDELSPEDANRIVAKAESFYGDSLEKPYQSADEAVETYASLYADKVRNDGGLWSFANDDMTFDPQEISADFKSSVENVARVEVENLPQYLLHKDTFKAQDEATAKAKSKSRSKLTF